MIAPYAKGKAMEKMNERQWKKQLVPRQEWYGHSFINKTSLVETISIVLLVIVLFSTWNTITSVIHFTSHTRQAQSTHTHLQPSFARLNINFIIQAIHDEQIATRIDRLLTREMRQEEFSGSVLIAHNGHTILSKGYSMASWSRGRANTPHTRFYLGSMTKQFTAMAILILQQRGKLRVSASICTYISPCPWAWGPVTLHELLTHTSGIPGVDDTDLSNASPTAWVSSFNAFPMAFRPGSQFDYCNVCYQLLGYVVERVSGRSYSDFLQQAIFNPLHMKNTGFNPYYSAKPDHADGYDAWQDEDELTEWRLNPQWSFLFGAGLLYSTVEDIYRWDQALFHSTLISRKTRQTIFTPYVPSQYAGSRYGYGWFITRNAGNGRRLIWHDGKIPGFRTYNGFYPRNKITLIILSNLATLDEIALANAIQKIIFLYQKMH
jgi:CubicO group peptidase (beta-lactamase class C family)